MKKGKFLEPHLNENPKDFTLGAGTVPVTFRVCVCLTIFLKVAMPVAEHISWPDSEEKRWKNTRENTIIL